MALVEPVAHPEQAVAPQLREIAGRGLAPGGLALARDRLLPVLPALSDLLPDAGLRRGATIAIDGGTAATSLAFALIAGASAAGSWCAAVGAPTLGLVAAAGFGVELSRFPLIAAPPPASWSTVVAALLDAMDAVLAWPPRRAPVRTTENRRLVARARERGAVLVMLGDARLEGADVRLSATSSRWEGMGEGHGHLVAREVEVVAGGRGAATRPRRVRLWLPASDGQVALA